MRKSITFVCLFIIFSIMLQGCTMLDSFMPQKELSAEEIYEMVSSAVVEITAWSVSTVNTGSGFFWDSKGTVITNYHVIEGCSFARITLGNGQEYDVEKVIGYSESKDIAILSTKYNDSIYPTIRNGEVNTGETVYAIGSSLGLTGSLSNGIVSSASRMINDNTYIQITAPISHGNSGGPLIDSKGQVIGITCASLSEGQNINFAIPICEVNNIVTENPLLLEELFEIVLEPQEVFVRTITICPENYESDHSWESAAFTAGFILELWKIGEATEDSMIELMNQYGSGQGSDLISVTRGTFVDEVDSWCFDPTRNIGDAEIIENVYGYTIIYFAGAARQ